MVQTKTETARRHRRWPLVLAIVILFLAVVVYVAQSQINPIATKILRDQAATYFEDRLRVGEVRVSLWRGALIINNLDLKQPPGFGAGSLLKTETIKIYIAIMPLLQKQLSLKGITIVAPEINLVQSGAGQMNTQYYLAKFTAQPQDPRAKPFKLHLNRFTVKKGRVSFSSPAVSSRQPALLFTQLNLRLNDLNLPNESRLPSLMHLDGVIAAAHPGRLQADGSGVFGAGVLDFNINSRIDRIWVPDFAYLVPNNKVIIEAGEANMTSQATCKANYLKSIQYVKIKDLKMSATKGSVEANLIGMPSDAFIKVLQDKHGAIDFDFVVAGYLSDLKVNLKQAITAAVARSLKAKLGSAVAAVAQTAVKEAVNKAVQEKVDQTAQDALKKLFK